MSPINIGTRRELFIDDHLIERRNNLKLELRQPTARNLAVKHDAPWEGNTCCYHTVFQDGDRYCMYYRGSNHDFDTGKPTHEVTCYAESPDGIHWEKPDLGLFEFNASKANNIVWNQTGAHDFAPFKDPNPDCAPDARYKALARGPGGLYAFQSPDGVHWSYLVEHPVITEGAFDSQNLAFWDARRGCYVDFHRGFRPVGDRKVRDIMTCTSTDFLTWTEPSYITHAGAPVEQLYTNQITPYHRAPHIYMGFPMRFVPERTVYDISKGGVSDGVFMTSRDGHVFHRRREAFIRPGLRPENWICRNNMVAWGILETASRVPGQTELSIFSTEHYYSRTQCDQIRRYTLRLDGFSSVHADAEGGDLRTHPLVFFGQTLALNMSTSAVGGLRVELQTPGGQPIEGFTLADCDDLYGDAVDGSATWQGKSDLSALSNTPVRLHVKMHDADLFAIQFV